MLYCSVSSSLAQTGLCRFCCTALKCPNSTTAWITGSSSRGGLRQALPCHPAIEERLTQSNQKGEHGVTPWMKGGICSYYWCCHTVFALTTCGMTARERVNPEPHCNMKKQYISVSFSNFFLGAWTQAKFFEKLQVCVLYLQMSTESTVTVVLRQTLRVFPVMEGNV